MLRRQLLAHFSRLPFLGLGAGPVQAPARKLNIMMKSAWGSDDPTRASFPFLHGLALADAGHEVQIFLTGEALLFLSLSSNGLTGLLLNDAVHFIVNLRKKNSSKRNRKRPIPAVSPPLLC